MAKRQRISVERASNCAFCHSKPPEVELTDDHIVELWIAGEVPEGPERNWANNYFNEEWNIQTLCKRCHDWKTHFMNINPDERNAPDADPRFLPWLKRVFTDMLPEGGSLATDETSTLGGVSLATEDGSMVNDDTSTVTDDDSPEDQSLERRRLAVLRALDVMAPNLTAKTLDMTGQAVDVPNTQGSVWEQWLDSGGSLLQLLQDFMTIRDYPDDYWETFIDLSHSYDAGLRKVSDQKKIAIYFLDLLECQLTRFQLEVVVAMGAVRQARKLNPKDDDDDDGATDEQFLLFQEFDEKFPQEVPGTLPSWVEGTAWQPLFFQLKALAELRSRRLRPRKLEDYAKVADAIENTRLVLNGLRRTYEVKKLMKNKRRPQG